MPALQWCFRKWRTGSDDFFWSGFVLGGASLAGGVMAVNRISDDGASLDGCPLATETFRASIHAMGIVSVIVGGLFGVVGALSARGRIFDVKKRAWVPVLLYVISVILLAQLIVSIIAAVRGVYDGEASSCDTFLTRSMIRASIALSIFVPSAFIAMMTLSFDPSGRKKFDTEEEYTKLWENRFSFMCCCFSSSAAGPEAFAEAAKTLAIVFRGLDLVPSDIAAGMLLLQGYQTTRRYETSKLVKFAPDPLGREEVPSSQARLAPPLTAAQRTIVSDIHHFSKYYLGAYGWMLYTYMNVCSGLPKLCAADTFMCCRRRHEGVSHEETCGCDTTALKKVTGLREHEILLTSFINTIYRPCFYVALDASTNSVVVAVRGTMSLEDCITDMVAAPAEVVLDEAANIRGWVHSGMLRSASNVLQVMIADGVMDEIIRGKFATSNLMVIGHSLGAGTAAILSVLLKTRYGAELSSRLRCITYAPPGGLFSESVRQYCDTFMVGVLVGFDVIPRMSSQNFNHLRDSIVAALSHSSASKAEVFCSCCCPRRLGDRLEEFQPHVDSVPMQTLRRIADRSLTFDSVAVNMVQGSGPVIDRTVHLYTPLTMVHYVKMVRQGKAGCCCLTDDGGNSMWTRLVSNEVWCPMFIDPKELDFVVCHPMMTLDHFPDRIMEVIEGTQQRLVSGELDRFMTGPLTSDNATRSASGSPIGVPPSHHSSPTSPFAQIYVPTNTNLSSSTRYQAA